MSIIKHTPEVLVEINNTIARLKQLEDQLVKIDSGSAKDVKEGLLGIIKKTRDHNDHEIHRLLQQKLMPGEDAAAIFGELKALEGARMCMDDMHEEIMNTQKYMDQISDKISNMAQRKKEVEQSLAQQENA